MFLLQLPSFSWTPTDELLSGYFRKQRTNDHTIWRNRRYSIRKSNRLVLSDPYSGWETGVLSLQNVTILSLLNPEISTTDSNGIADYNTNFAIAIKTPNEPKVLRVLFPSMSELETFIGCLHSLQQFLLIDVSFI